MHISAGKLLPSSEYAVGEDKARQLSQYRLKKGDVILGRRGEMGRAAVIRNSAEGYICGTGALFIRPLSEDLDPDFLCFFLRSPQAIKALEENAVGSTMVNLNRRIVSALECPDIHISEQREIVRRVEALFTLADAIEDRVVMATARVEKLTQSILAKAFRGELVPTEAELARREGREFETASALLIRMRTRDHGRAPQRIAPVGLFPGRMNRMPGDPINPQ